MHFFRISLVFLHILSALTYFPHLIFHIKHIPFFYIPFRSQTAYTIYWINYSLLVLIILIWCLIVVCREQTTWEIMQVSGILLLIKLIYTSLDVIVRILLRYNEIIIAFDFVHIGILIPAILLTFLFVYRLKKNSTTTTTILLSTNHEHLLGV